MDLCCMPICQKNMSQKHYGNCFTDGCESATATLTGCHRYLQEYRDTVRKGLLDRALWKRANHCIVHATTVWAFIGKICFWN